MRPAVFQLFRGTGSSFVVASPTAVRFELTDVTHLVQLPFMRHEQTFFLLLRYPLRCLSGRLFRQAVHHLIQPKNFPFLFDILPEFTEARLRFECYGYIKFILLNGKYQFDNGR